MVQRSSRRPLSGGEDGGRERCGRQRRRSWSAVRKSLRGEHAFVYGTELLQHDMQLCARFVLVVVLHFYPIYLSLLMRFSCTILVCYLADTPLPWRRNLNGILKALNRGRSRWRKENYPGVLLKVAARAILLPQKRGFRYRWRLSGEPVFLFPIEFKWMGLLQLFAKLFHVSRRHGRTKSPRK